MSYRVFYSTKNQTENEGRKRAEHPSANRSQKGLFRILQHIDCIVRQQRKIDVFPFKYPLHVDIDRRALGRADNRTKNANMIPDRIFLKAARLL